MVRGQREKIQNGSKGDKRLKTRVELECSISRRRARLYSEGIHVRGVRGESHSVTSGDTAGGSSKSESCQEF